MVLVVFRLMQAMHGITFFGTPARDDQSSCDMEMMGTSYGFACEPVEGVALVPVEQTVCSLMYLFCSGETYAMSPVSPCPMKNWRGYSCFVKYCLGRNRIFDIEHFRVLLYEEAARLGMDVDEIERAWRTHDISGVLFISLVVDSIRSFLSFPGVHTADENGWR